MQMRSRRSAGLADIGDDLAGFDLLACGHADARAVGIQRGQPAAVVELDVVAIAASPTVEGVGDSDGAVGGGQDRGALGHSDVGAAVVAGLAGDRVGAVALRRGDRARHRQRPLQGTVGQCGVGAGRQDFTAQFTHSKTAEQIGPERGYVIGGKQGQVLVLAGVEVIFLAHFLGCFVVQGKNEDGLGHRGGAGIVLIFI